MPMMDLGYVRSFFEGGLEEEFDAWIFARDSSIAERALERAEANGWVAPEGWAPLTARKAPVTDAEVEAAAQSLSSLSDDEWATCCHEEHMRYYWVSARLALEAARAVR